MVVGHSAPKELGQLLRGNLGARGEVAATASTAAAARGQPEMGQDGQAGPHLETPAQASSDWVRVSPGRQWKGRR